MANVALLAQVAFDFVSSWPRWPRAKRYFLKMNTEYKYNNHG